MIDPPVPPAGADDVRLRAAFASVAEVAGAGESCPSADALWEAVAGRCDRARLEAVILHLGECGACATAWRLARELREGGAEARVLPGPSRWYRRTWVQVAAAAAALVVAAGLAVQLRTSSPRGPAEFRGQDGDWIQPLVPESRELPRERCVLRWTPGPRGTVYDVRVVTDDLAPVARGRGSEAAEFLVPPGSLEPVPPGGRIVWQVTAHLPDGGKVDSRSFTNSVR